MLWINSEGGGCGLLGGREEAARREVTGRESWRQRENRDTARKDWRQERVRDWWYSYQFHIASTVSVATKIN